MSKFKFYQDRKKTIWTRQPFEVEAETEEEATSIAKSLVAEDIEYLSNTDNGTEILTKLGVTVDGSDFEIMHDTLGDPEWDTDSSTSDIMNYDGKTIESI